MPTARDATSPCPPRRARALLDWVGHARGTPPGPPFVRGGEEYHPPLTKGGFGGVNSRRSPRLPDPIVNRSRWLSSLLLVALLAGPAAADEPRAPKAAKIPPLPPEQRRAIAAIEGRTGL